MLPTLTTTHQELAPPREQSFLYLAVSQQDTNAFKLGVTTALPHRFKSLRLRYGSLDLQASLLVVAVSQRAARDLENVLKVVFRAPAWRTKAPLREGRKAHRAPSNGDKEWYKLCAFEQMITFIAATIERDTACDLHRFKAVRDIQHSAVWQAELHRDKARKDKRATKDVDRAIKIAMHQNEARFQTVQAWMQARRSQLVSATPLALDAQGNYQRSFVFRVDAAHDQVSGRFDDGAEALASLCCVSHYTGHGPKHCTYFAGTVWRAEDPALYEVEFLVTASLMQASGTCRLLRDSVAKITDWLKAPPVLP